MPRILGINIPEEKRRDYYLYVDEFQNFATPDFAVILSEARKFRLNLCVANQFIGQKEAGPKRVFKKCFPTVYKVFSDIKINLMNLQVHIMI